MKTFTKQPMIFISCQQLNCLAKRFLLSALILFAIKTCTVAQNLVINPGFETYGLPLPCGWTGGGAAFAAALPGWTSPTQGSPDVHSTLVASSCTNYSPHSTTASTNGWQAPHGGDMFAGFYTQVGGSTWREYVQCQLSTPMIVGHYYNVSMYISLSDNSQFATNNLGIGLSPTLTNLAISNELGYAPQINFTSVMSDTANWVKLSAIFYANTNYQYLIIGNFYSDANTIISNFNPGGVWDRSYYYVDDVSVTEALTFTNTCLGDTTFFTNPTQPGSVATMWDFGDPATGLNNVAYTAAAYHIFSDTGTYLVTTINYQFSGINDTLYTSVSISQPPVISLGNDTAFCTGSSYLLNAGNGFASYLWQDGSSNSTFTATVAGTYIVTVTQGGCDATDTIVVSTLPCNSTVALFASSDTSFCEKLCIDFYDLSTNNPTSWQWFFPGADSTTSTLQNPTDICYNNYGSYAVTLIACNSFGCDTLLMNGFINEYQTPIPVITQSNDTLFSSSGVSYQWWSVGSGIIAGATNYYYVPTSGGDYFVIVTDTVGCAGTSNVITITGVGELAIGNWQTAIMPNPNNGNFTLTLNQPMQNDYSIRVIDVIGKVVRAETTIISQNKIEVEMGNVAKGIYSIEIVTGNMIYNSRFVIR